MHDQLDEHYHYLRRQLRNIASSSETKTVFQPHTFWHLLSSRELTSLVRKRLSINTPPPSTACMTFPRQPPIPVTRGACHVFRNQSRGYVTYIRNLDSDEATHWFTCTLPSSLIDFIAYPLPSARPPRPPPVPYPLTAPGPWQIAACMRRPTCI